MLLNDRIGQAIASAQPRKRQVAVLLADLSHAEDAVIMAAPGWDSPFARKSSSGMAATSRSNPRSAKALRFAFR
jgi:hypothetical protein